MQRYWCGIECYWVSVAACRRLKSLVQLKYEDEAFKVVRDSSKVPKWFHTKHLRDPKAVYMEGWLVEVMFGRDGEYIPHVKCVTHTLLHMNQWNPEEEAEILIFGPPYYQEDICQMILNLGDYFCRELVKQAGYYFSQKTGIPCLLVEDDDDNATTQQVPVEDADDADTLLGPVAVHEEASEAATGHTSGEVHQDVTKQSPIEVCEAAIPAALLRGL